MGIKYLCRRALGSYHQMRVRAIEGEHRIAFQRFYAGLEDHHNLFYMFFTSGLLHWAKQSLELVPPDVNVVLLGCNLQADEEDWVRRRISRPFHHLRLATDDKTVWEFLFETNHHHFGWLDVDCFVFNPDLFYRMADIGDDVAINCAWTDAGPESTAILQTYFSFFNVEIARTVNRQVQVSPTTYSFEEFRQGRSAPHAFPRVPSERQIKLLRKVLPRGEDGLPVYVTESHFYDTLQLYQLVARALGYRLNQVGPVRHEDAFHIGKVSYYKHFKQFTHPARQGVYRLVMQADYLMLSALCDELPPLYAARRDELAFELEASGLTRSQGQVARSLGEAMRSIGADENIMQRILRRA